MENLPDLLTRAEAAAFLRTPAQTLSYWACRRQGPRFTRIGRRVVYRRTDLEAFIDSSPAGGAPQV
jgi:hypothetical protein